jgi:hypothetical protein
MDPIVPDQRHNPFLLKQEQDSYLSGKMIRNNILGDNSIDYAMRRPEGRQYAKYGDRRTPTAQKTMSFTNGAHARAGRRPKEG